MDKKDDPPSALGPVIIVAPDCRWEKVTLLHAWIDLCQYTLDLQQETL